MPSIVRMYKLAASRLPSTLAAGSYYVFACGWADLHLGASHMTSNLSRYLWLTGLLGLLGLFHPGLYGLFGLFGLLAFQVKRQS